MAATMFCMEQLKKANEEHHRIQDVLESHLTTKSWYKMHEIFYDQGWLSEGINQEITGWYSIGLLWNKAFLVLVNHASQWVHHTWWFSHSDEVLLSNDRVRELHVKRGHPCRAGEARGMKVHRLEECTSSVYLFSWTLRRLGETFPPEVELIWH